MRLLPIFLAGVLYMLQQVIAGECEQWNPVIVNKRPMEMKKSRPSLENAGTDAAKVHTVYTNRDGARINTYYHLGGLERGILEVIVQSGGFTLLFEQHLINFPKNITAYQIPPGGKICTLRFTGSDMDKIIYYRL